MKKLLLILAIVTIGCVMTNQAVYRETANFNVLDLGSSKVSIDKRFVLVGELKSTLNTDTNVDDRSGTDWRVTRYVFVDASDGKDKVRRAIVVFDQSMVKSTHIFLSDASYENFKGAHLDKGMTERLGLRCAYLVQSASSVAKDITDLAASKGFYMDKEKKKGVGIHFAKHVGSSRKVVILYIEGETSQALVFDNAAKFIRFEG